MKRKGEDLEEARKQAVGLLKEYGWVTPRIKQSKVARKYRTITGLDYFQRGKFRGFGPLATAKS